MQRVSINDDEIEELARLTFRKPYHVRFIELMPTLGWVDKTGKGYYYYHGYDIYIAIISGGSFL